MAKSKSEDENESVTYQGKVVDPDVQKKVESYMELDAEDLAEDGPEAPDENVAQPKKINITHHDELPEEDDSSTAPLLPTDKLPGSLVDKSAKSAVAVPVIASDDGEAEGLSGDTPELTTENDREEDKDTNDDSLAEEEPEANLPEAKSITVKEENSDEETEPLEEVEVEPPEQVEENDKVLSESEEETPDDAEDVTPEEEAEEQEESEAPAEELAGDSEDDINKYENEPEKLVGPAGALWTKYQNKTIADLDEDKVQPVIDEDIETEEAIKEIIAEDSDKLLGIEDKKRKEVAPINAPRKKKTEPTSAGAFFKGWFTHSILRNLTILIILAVIAAFAVVPATRYYFLNLAGVRVTTSMRIMDSKTDLPLKNVEVSIDGKTAKTDKEGNATITELKLGNQELTVKKPAFGEITKAVTLGWGSNPLGDIELNPTGSRIKFEATDYLSKKPIRSGEIIYGESSAQFNLNGEAVISIPEFKQEEIEIQVTADDYRTEKIKVTASKKQDKYRVALVPSKKHVFFSKRSGKVDLYKADVDGKNQEIILVGSGIETDDSLGIAPHPTKAVVAFSSSRENIRSSEGALLNTLQIINMDTNQISRVTQSERIQIVDWIGDRLIYVKIAQGSSKDSTDRHRLMSYDLSSNQETELASTNYFNDVLSVHGAIYYSPALYKVNGSVGLYKVNADGGDKKTIFNKEVWNIFRTSYDKASISVGKDWYELDLKNDTLAKVGGAPSVLKSRLYVDSPDGKQSLWVDERDGKTVLIAYETATGKDRVLVTESGIQPPLTWLDNGHVVYRIENGQETADYVLSLSGGLSEKIADVTSSFGIDRWYYF